MVGITGRKGWLRVVEASIAALIIVSALLVITSRTQPSGEIDYSSITHPLLDEIAQNTSLRDEVLNYDSSSPAGSVNNNKILADLKIFLDNRIKLSSLKYSVLICAPEDLCTLANYPVDAKQGIYSAERLISTSPLKTISGDFSPKKLKIFIYRVG